MNDSASHVWRPPQTIRAKVIGIALHANRLLVCEVLDDQGKCKGWCPPGGGIDFGEASDKALHREIQEELECSITISEGPFACDNIFEHEGFQGHEIIFAYLIQLNNPEIYTKPRFQIRESRGSIHWVEWIDIAAFHSNQKILFPKPLLSKCHWLNVRD
jgi:ADP-ribose pyrophosphatase YjhB (NUDIX family)